MVDLDSTNEFRVDTYEQNIKLIMREKEKMALATGDEVFEGGLPQILEE